MNKKLVLFLGVLFFAASLLAKTVILQWDPPLPLSQVQYRVYQAKGNQFELVGQTGNLQFQTANLSPGKYSWRVTAFNQFGESLPSNTVKFNLKVSVLNALDATDSLVIVIRGNTIAVEWTGVDTLQVSDDVLGPYFDLDVVSPYVVPLIYGPKFFRLKSNDE
jgi:hypothetical protein